MKSLKKNIIYQSAYQILMVISPLITSPYLARTLGNEKYGTYSYFYSIAYYFGIFTILGLSKYGSRTIAKAKGGGKDVLNKVFSELFAMQGSMLILVSVIYLSVIMMFNGESYWNALIEWLYILSVGLDISWFYFGIEEFKTTTMRSFAVKIVMIVLILTLIKKPKDIYIYTLIMAGCTLISSLILWGNLSKYVRLQKVTFRGVIQHLKPNLLLFIPVVSVSIFHNTDKIMLGSMCDMSELGYYTNADKITSIPMGLISGLGNVMIPRIASLNGENRDHMIAKYVNISLVMSTWAGCALWFGVRTISEDFVPFFFGKGYDKCVELLGLLSAVILIKALASVIRTQYLIPLEKDIEYNVSVGVAAVINIILNSILIPQYGAMGAVYGTLAAETIVLISYIIFARKIILIKKIGIPILQCIVAGKIMLIIVDSLKMQISLQERFPRLAIEVLVGGMIYCCMTLLPAFILKRKRLIGDKT